MTKLWPRLPLGTASALLKIIEQGDELIFALENEKCYYAPIGIRTTLQARAELRESILGIAKAKGFPEIAADSVLAEFDLEVTEMLHAAMPMSWSEAGSREVWSFMALILLPDVTRWRWQHRLDNINRERWICSDMTRHTWARLWWRHIQVGGEYRILSQLGESGLNQFLERRDTIGASPELIRGLARRLDPSLTESMTVNLFATLDAAFSVRWRSSTEAALTEDERDS
ncbi:hypothetical protein GS461_17230 [Rhodococcus hoagii]|nr:hypothetical protein [Prescottella equi]